MARNRASLPTKENLRAQGRSALGTSGESWAQEAMQLLRDLGSKFGEELGHEAINMAKGEDLETVSKRHVEEAHQKLRAQRKGAWCTKFAGTVGGAFLGCEIGLLIAILQGQTTSILLVVALCSLSSIGTGLAIYHALRSR